MPQKNLTGVTVALCGYPQMLSACGINQPLSKGLHPTTSPGVGCTPHEAKACSQSLGEALQHCLAVFNGEKLTPRIPPRFWKWGVAKGRLLEHSNADSRSFSGAACDHFG